MHLSCSEQMHKPGVSAFSSNHPRDKVKPGSLLLACLVSNATCLCTLSSIWAAMECARSNTTPCQLAEELKIACIPP